MTLPQRIVAGLVAGLFVGLFLGEPDAVLQPLADIYIRLMQMTVLPYLVTALVICFGQLSVERPKRRVLPDGNVGARVFPVFGHGRGVPPARRLRWQIIHPIH